MRGANQLSGGATKARPTLRLVDHDDPKSVDIELLIERRATLLDLEPLAAQIELDAAIDASLWWPRSPNPNQISATNA